MVTQVVYMVCLCTRVCNLSYLPFILIFAAQEDFFLPFKQDADDSDAQSRPHWLTAALPTPTLS